MRVISRKSIKDFCQLHPQAEQPLKSWFEEAKYVNWITPQAIKDFYRSADILPDNRVVFNISGHKYHLVVKINYSLKIIFIRFIGTHAAYEEIDAEKI